MKAPGFDEHFWWNHAILPGLLLALVVLPFEVSDLDLWLTDPFYDFVGKRWPCIDAWWASALVHRGGKYFVWILGSVPAGVLLCSWHVARFARWRRTCFYLVACLMASPTAVVLLKVITNRHGPWGMTRYGGSVPWTRLFEFAPAVLSEGKYGRCFPAAHAATAFGLLGLYFVGRALGNRRPWLWAAPGLGLGLVFAVGQQVRGAHFFSHNLWSLAVAWSLSLGLYRAFGGRIGPQPARGGDPTGADGTSR